jgi:hypothetical protein
MIIIVVVVVVVVVSIINIINIINIISIIIFFNIILGAMGGSRTGCSPQAFGIGSPKNL